MTYVVTYIKYIKDILAVGHGRLVVEIPCLGWMSKPSKLPFYLENCTVGNLCRIEKSSYSKFKSIYAELVQWLGRSLPSYRDEFDPRIPLQIKSYVGVVEWLIAADCKSAGRKSRVGSNPATDSNYFCKSFMRIWYSGRAVACQATEASSNLAIRSSFKLLQHPLSNHAAVTNPRAQSLINISGQTSTILMSEESSVCWYESIRVVLKSTDFQCW